MSLSTGPHPFVAEVDTRSLRYPPAGPGRRAGGGVAAAHEGGGAGGAEVPRVDRRVPDRVPGGGAEEVPPWVGGGSRGGGIEGPRRHRRADTVVIVGQDRFRPLRRV